MTPPTQEQDRRLAEPEALREAAAREIADLADASVSYDNDRRRARLSELLTALVQPAQEQGEDASAVVLLRRLESAVSTYQRRRALNNGTAEGSAVLADARIALDDAIIAARDYTPPTQQLAQERGKEKLTMCLTLTEAEKEALERLVAKTDLSPERVYRQALRTYQLVVEGHSRLVDVEMGTRFFISPFLISALSHAIDLRRTQGNPAAAEYIERLVGMVREKGPS